MSCSYNVRFALRFSAAISFETTRCSSSDCCLSAFRSSFTSFLDSRSAISSSNDGTAGRFSIGSPNGATICFTTCRLWRDVGQPGAIATTSPVRREEFGS